MRSMWKGSISFGLVNIPVSLFKATEDHATSFRSLHQECKHPIQYKKWCPVCNKEIQAKEIVRGYEYAPGNYILITDDDLEELPLPTLRSIEILHFTDKDSIDPIYYEKAYYLGPGEYGGKPYKLLHNAMDATGKVAVAKVAFRTSEHLTVIRIHENSLVMNMIHYPDEVRAVQGVPGIDAVADTAVNDSELQMAKKLIEEISSAFRADYKSNYQEALKELIEAKIQNEEVEQPAAAPRADNVVDLMEALKKSLAATKGTEKQRQGKQRQAKQRQGKPSEAAAATGTETPAPGPGAAAEANANAEAPKRRRRKKTS